MVLKKLTAIAGLALLCAGSLVAGLSKDMVQWRKSATQFLMTQDEMKKWDTLKKDEEAKEFLDLFWARRDPTPDTPVNEFKDLFDARVAFADKNYTYHKVRGSVTDRGKVIVLLGVPTRAQRQGNPIGADTIAPPAPGENPEDPGLDAVAAPSERATRTETWTYEYRADERNRVPAWAPKQDITVNFVDQSGVGDFRLGKSTETSNIDELMKTSVQVAIVNPNLTAAPKPNAKPAPAVAAVPAVKDESLKTDALKAAIEEFKAAKDSPYQDVYLSYGSFITPAGDYFVPVQLYLAKPGAIAANPTATFFGTVEDASGAVVKTYETPVKLQPSHTALFADKSLSLEAGKYTAYFGIAAEGKPLTLAKASLDLTPLEKDASGVSPLILSDNIYALQVAQEPTAPYSFGGTKVVVKADKTFTKKDELWFFYELRNPGLDPAGAPKLQMKIDVEGVAGKQKIKMGVPLQDAAAEPLKGVTGHYAVGHSIPLASFPAGEYTMKIKVIDGVNKLSYDLQDSFKVVAE